MQFKPRPTDSNPRFFKKLNKFEEIAMGGRVSNPVLGSARPMAGVSPEIADARRTWSAEVLSEVAVPEFELEEPEDAM